MQETAVESVETIGAAGVSNEAVAGLSDKLSVGLSDPSLEAFPGCEVQENKRDIHTPKNNNRKQLNLIIV